jgi:hypothetical protein
MSEAIEEILKRQQRTSSGIQAGSRPRDTPGVFSYKHSGSQGGHDPGPRFGGLGDYDPTLMHNALWRPGDEPEFMLIGNPANPRLRRQYEREKGPWPRVPETGRNYDVAHKKAIADGGTNTLDNIRPMHPDAHRAEHMANGDPARWARRQWIARAFGGRVVPGLNIFSLIPGLTGILSGRIRTDSFDNFTSDMTGVQSQDDFKREQDGLRRQINPQAPPGTLFL